MSATDDAEPSEQPAVEVGLLARAGIPESAAPAREAGLGGVTLSYPNDPTPEEADALIDAHRPTVLSPADRELARRAVGSAHETIGVTVLAVDIRKSTFVMKEAVDFSLYARTISAFVDFARAGLRDFGGWWDKFTGDGWLSYWIAEDPEDLDRATQAVGAAIGAIEYFDGLVLPALRANSRNFPAGVGISAGIDAGPGSLALVAGDLTVVGSPMVGAVRMVDVAEAPGEIIANVRVGEHFLRAPERLPFANRVQVTIEERQTKEYVQDVYPIVVDRASLQKEIAAGRRE
jgi:class 3 adenylate cyclase